MPAYLEVWLPSGARLVTLADRRVTVGKDPSSDVHVTHDATVSRLHAVLEPYGSAWAIRDLGSHNGTYLNGERVFSERVLRPGDELRVGRTRLVYRGDFEKPESGGTTQSGDPRPELTRRERDVLVALCRPLLSSEPFRQPASIRELAAELVVTEAAIKQHLLRLYDKFGIYEDGESRRVRLANEAVRRGSVRPAELRAPPER